MSKKKQQQKKKEKKKRRGKRLEREMSRIGLDALQRKVRTDALITHIFDITDWEKAFGTFEDKTGIKTLLKPVG